MNMHIFFALTLFALIGLLLAAAAGAVFCAALRDGARVTRGDDRERHA
jgi:hypothetical protein